MDNSDKKLAAQYIEQYLISNPTPRGTLYRRTKQWVDGQTISEIADLEGVSYQSVHQAITNYVNKIKLYKKSIDKR